MRRHREGSRSTRSEGRRVSDRHGGRAGLVRQAGQRRQHRHLRRADGGDRPERLRLDADRQQREEIFRQLRRRGLCHQEPDHRLPDGQIRRAAISGSVRLRGGHEGQPRRHQEPDGSGQRERRQRVLRLFGQRGRCGGLRQLCGCLRRDLPR